MRLWTSQIFRFNSYRIFSIEFKSRRLFLIHHSVLNVANSLCTNSCSVIEIATHRKYNFGLSLNIKLINIIIILLLLYYINRLLDGMAWSTNIVLFSESFRFLLNHQYCSDTPPRPLLTVIFLQVFQKHKLLPLATQQLKFRFFPLSDWPISIFF